VNDADAKRRVLAELGAQLSDDRNAFDLHADGTQVPRWGGRRDCQAADDHRKLRSSFGRAPRRPGGRAAPAAAPRRRLAG